MGGARNKVVLSVFVMVGQDGRRLAVWLVCDVA